MMSEKLIITGTFDTANVKKDGIAAVRFKFPFMEIANWVKLLTHVNAPGKMLVIPENGEKIKFGEVLFKSLSVDKDGEAKLTVEGEANSMDLSQTHTMIDKCVKVCIKFDEEDSDE